MLLPNIYLHIYKEIYLYLSKTKKYLIHQYKLFIALKNNLFH